MVVKVPDNFGDMISKGNVVIPCQCYYNARDNILTQVINHSYNPFLQSSEHIPQSNQPNNSFENNQIRKDAQTETPVEQCCICEYFRNLEMNQNKKKLWNMQFNRWWGWNWQRKRNDLLSKLKMKCNRNSTNDTAKCNVCLHQIPKHIEEPSYSSKETFVPERRKIPKNVPQFAEPKQAIPHSSTYGFRKPYVSRRKKYKRKQRQYEGWVKEINSSESDESVKSIKLKMKCPDSPNIQETGNYLSLRLRKINSDESLDYDYHYPKNKLISRQADAKYVSPLSGKYYNINLPEISLPISETFDTEYLKPINIKDSLVIPKLRYDFVENFSLIKDEHRKLLIKINEILNSSKIIDKLDKNTYTEPQKVFKSFDTAVSASPITNTLDKHTSCNLLNHKFEEKNEIFLQDHQKPPIFTEHKSDTIFTSTNPFYNSVYKDQRSKSVNLPYFSKFGEENSIKNIIENENISLETTNSISNQDSLLATFNTKSVEKSLGEVEYMEVDVREESNYYVNNNLFANASSTTEANYVQKQNVTEDEQKKFSCGNIKEDMSERILQEVDYLNNLTLSYN